MILQIDTSKVPDKDTAFLAEVVLESYKFSCTIDQIIEGMRDLLRLKEKLNNEL